MKPFECLYIPIGVLTFHIESAKKAFIDTVKALNSIDENIIVPEDMCLTIDSLLNYIDRKNPDIIILQNVTFANAAYATEIFKLFSVPVILWTLPEPVIDGGRLRLNSLTGAFAVGNAHKNFNKDILIHIFGSPNEKRVQTQLQDIIEVAKLKYTMKRANLLVVGHTPQGFGFGRVLDLEMANTFGMNVIAIESRELTQLARKTQIEETHVELDIIQHKIVGLDQINVQNRVDFVKLFKVYNDYIIKNNIKAIASRCWPDFFTEYGTPVCAVLAMLNDLNIAAACEADAYGALSMYIGQQLSHKPTYLGDPVSLNESENTVTFWHCGTAACSLARGDQGAKVGVHPNRQIGPTMEFGLKEQAQATIFRIGRNQDGSFRFLVSRCEILDKPQQFLGTSVVVKFEKNVKTMISQLIIDGWEPHFVLIYGDIVNKLKYCAQLFHCEIVEV